MIEVGINMSVCEREVRVKALRFVLRGCWRLRF